MVPAAMQQQRQRLRRSDSNVRTTATAASERQHSDRTSAGEVQRQQRDNTRALTAR